MHRLERAEYSVRPAQVSIGKDTLELLIQYIRSAGTVAFRNTIFTLQWGAPEASCPLFLMKLQQILGLALHTSLVVVSVYTIVFVC